MTNAARWATLAGIAVTAGLVAFTAALAHRWIQVEGRIDAVQAEQRALDATLGPTLAARERALRQAGELQWLATRLLAPQPLELMQHLAEMLPRKGVQLRDFELNGSKLRLGLDVADTVARSALVRDLQAGGWLKGIAETKDAAFKGTLVLEMTVDGGHPVVLRAAPPAPAAAPSASAPASARTGAG